MPPATAPASLEDLHDQIDVISKKVEAYLREAGDDAQDAASRAAFKVMEASRALSHETRLRGRRMIKDAAATAREHPLAVSAALAAAVAGLAGVIAMASRGDVTDVGA